MPMRDRVGGDVIAHGRAVDRDLAAVGGRQAEDGLGQLRASRSDEPGNAENLAAPDRERRRRRTPARAFDRSRHSSSTVSPSGTSRLGNTASSSRPTIIRIKSARDRRRRASRVATVWPSRSTVMRSAIGGNLLQPVRNVDDADALSPRSARDHARTAASPRARSARRSARP